MKKATALLSISLMILAACKNEDGRITEQLKSHSPGEIISGTYAAGLSGDKKYVPLLLTNAADPSASTLLQFKGFTIYTEKMHALERILHIKPPHAYGGILRMPDSVNIKFYNNLWQKMNQPK